MSGEQNSVCKGGNMLETLFWIVGLVIVVIVLCVVFSFAIGVILICACIPLIILSPLYLGCLIHMKIKGYKQHEYHFLGSTIKIKIGKDDTDK